MRLTEGCRIGRNNLGQTAMHHAVQAGNVEAIRYFISLGVDIDDTDNDEETPFHQVSFADENFKETVSVLVENGCDVNAVDKHGDNALFLSAFRGRSRDELEELMQHGISYQLRNNDDETVLHKAAVGGNVDGVELFISLGVDVNAKETSGETPLLLATHAKRNFKEVLTSLVKAGSDINAADHDGSNVMHLAALRGRSREELEAIIKLGFSTK